MQIVHKRGRTVLGIDHIGSAHDEDQLALLLETAKQRLHADQQALEIDLTPPQHADPGTPVVDATGSLILWQALCGVYDALGFGAVGDEAFRALVLARIVEPTSKLDTVRVLDELGVTRAVAGDVDALPQTCHRRRLPIGDRRRLLPARDP